MRLVYIANTRIPTEKAHGWQIMKMCESFARAGAMTELVLPKRRNPDFGGADPFIHYGVEGNFSVLHLPCPDLIRFRLPRFLSLPFGLVQNWLYVHALRRHLMSAAPAGEGNEKTILFSREQRLLYMLRKLPHAMIYEVHDFPEAHTRKYKKLFKRVNLIVATNEWKKNELHKRFGVPLEKIHVAPHAIDDAFLKSITREEARTHLNLPVAQKIALYAGSFQKWKGVYVLGEAIAHLPKDITVYFLGGGAEPDRSTFVNWLKQKKYSNVVVHDAVLHTEMPYWLAAADVLVAPGTAHDQNAAYYTSPLKLFEYFASGRPVVLSSLPSVCETVRSIGAEMSKEEGAAFTPPDDPVALAENIAFYLKEENRDRFSGKSMRQLFGKKDSWQQRAHTIINTVERSSVPANNR